MPAADITQITVNLLAGDITRAGFGTLLIAGTNGPAGAYSGNLVNTYAQLTDLDDDGWLGTEDEYKAAQVAFSNDADRVKVARFDTAFVAQVDTITFTGGTDGDRTITFAGPWFEAPDTPFLHTAATNTAEQIRDAFVTAINLDTDLPITAAAVSTDQMTLTSNTAGGGFSTTLGGANVAEMTLALTTPNLGYAQELADVLNEDSDWYCLVGVDEEAAHVGERAAYIEGLNDRVHVARTADADVDAAAQTNDIGTRLQTLSYKRSLLLYHETAGELVDAALAGDRLSVDADETATQWAGVELSGITKQSLTTTQQTALDGKNVNYYTEQFGKGVTYPGKASSGLFFDHNITRDWVRARIREDLFVLWTALINSGRKIPYTEEGLSLIESTVRAVIRRGARIGHLTLDATASLPDGPIYTFPSRAATASADVAAGIYRFSVEVAAAGGVINFVGTVYLQTT